MRYEGVFRTYICPTRDGCSRSVIYLIDESRHCPECLPTAIFSVNVRNPA